MRISTLFLSTVAMMAVNGYKIDPNLPDGTYFIPALNASEKSLNKLFGEPIRIGDIAPLQRPPEAQDSGVTAPGRPKRREDHFTEHV
ncbi:hypothetical protein F5B19DRAFT_493760 [Rostrohypoxylon terebratum]|nr:hypothetical protein F5B19DRAFT_493760 [Rostrohypoxylon terebratum]